MASMEAEFEEAVLEARQLVETQIRSTEGWKEYKKSRDGRVTVLQKCFELTSDKSKRRSWDPHYVEEHTYTVKTWKHDSLGDVIVYRDSHSAMLGGIISGRDMANVRNSLITESRYESIFVSKDMTDIIPLAEGYVRAFCHPSGMVGEVVEDGVLRLHYVLQTDPRGKIPLWAMGKAVAQSIIDFYEFLMKEE